MQASLLACSYLNTKHTQPSISGHIWTHNSNLNGMEYLSWNKEHQHTNSVRRIIATFFFENFGQYCRVWYVQCLLSAWISILTLIKIASTFLQIFVEKWVLGKQSWSSCSWALCTKLKHEVRTNFWLLQQRKYSENKHNCIDKLLWKLPIIIFIFYHFCYT